jgi:outer membrane immunogenic protein
MNRFVAASLAVAGLSIGFASAASAADLSPAPAPVYTKAPVAAPVNWTGFYLGVNFGGHEEEDKDAVSITSNTGAVAAVAATQLGGDAPVSLSRTGAAGGLQFGYNWQVSQFVYGLEADFDGLSSPAAQRLLTDGSGAFTVTPANFIDNANDRWMATARARAGYAYDRALFYATGGAAFSSWETSHSLVVSTTSGTESASFTRTGWVAGGGIEYMFARNWITRIEYLYADFGTANNTLTATSATAHTITFAEPEKLTDQMLRVGVSYKFQ